MVWTAAALALLLSAPAASAEGGAPERAALREALEWIATGSELRAEYRYVMTAKIRLLLFWVGRDDVGGGTIRFSRGGARPEQERISVLFGSDPTRAPRRINRWGAATEVVQPAADGPAGETAVFFGFMKSSKGESAEQMKAELAAEANGGRHLFQASVGRIAAGQALTVVFPWAAERDLDLHGFQQAEGELIARFAAADAPLRRLDQSRAGCHGRYGFLFTLNGMIEQLLDGRRGELSGCYVHNARLYRLELKRAEPVRRHRVKLKLHDQRTLERDDHNLLHTEFEIRNLASGQRTDFELLLGLAGPERGVPVQIVHQPKWWFKVILNLSATVGEAGLMPKT
jgi:hypothetical protein